MKKITCISYHCTGSGAVDDFLREFEYIKSASPDIECRFLQDPDGIADLEYNLVDNWHRLNSGFAIKRFKKFVSFYNHTYSLIFGDNWKKYCNEYINKLTDFEFNGYWHADIRLQSFIKQYIYYLKRIISKLLPKRYRRTPDYNYFPHLKSYYSHPSKEKFYKCTQELCDNLCNSISDYNTEFVVLDQLISTSNIKRYQNYINNLKIIIVDRDPRDLYVQCISANTHVLPHNIKLFCKQYIDMRKTIEEEIKNKNVIMVQYEDLIYKYEETTKRISDFLGLDEKQHKYKRKFFDPKISIKYTQIWKDNKKYNDEISYIEKKLKNYCYNFNK